MDWLSDPAVTLLDDVAAGDWIEQTLWPWIGRGEVRVGSLVPEGFEAYARINHPGSPEDEVGSLPPVAATALAQVLAGHTTTPQECWMALWDGFGFLHPGAWTYLARYPGLRGWWQRWRRRRDLARRRKQPSPLDRHPRLETDGRSYLLLRGPVAAVATAVDRGRQTPNIWWPDDRRWCVATEIDLACTYVGGTADCVAAVLARTDLDAATVSVDDRIDAGAEDP